MLPKKKLLPHHLKKSYYFVYLQLSKCRGKSSALSAFKHLFDFEFFVYNEQANFYVDAIERIHARKYTLYYQGWWKDVYYFYYVYHSQ